MVTIVKRSLGPHLLRTVTAETAVDVHLIDGSLELEEFFAAAEKRWYSSGNRVLERAQRAFARQMHSEFAVQVQAAQDPRSARFATNLARTMLGIFRQLIREITERKKRKKERKRE